MASSPKVPAWFHPDDPWLTARMRRVTQIRQGETEVGRAVLKAMALYLDEAHRAVLGGGTVRAAADDAPPDLDAWPGRPLWQRLVAEFVMPVIRALFLLAFDDETPEANRPRQHPEPDAPDGPEQPEDPEPATIIMDSRHYQRAYLDKVNDRLVIWPDGAFEQVRTELQAGLALGQDQRGLRDRVGRALSIDAQSRALVAQIDKLTQTIENPGTPPQIVREARARRSALYRRKDREDQRWWPSAARIARTESAGALSGGTYAGAAANQERDGVQRWMQWWSTTDERVRPSHWAAHMQVRKLGEKFSVGGHLLDHPGDPTAPADEVINCRCSPLTLHSEEEADKQRDLWERFLPGRTDRLGRPIDADGQVVAADAQGNTVRNVPGYEGSIGPFPGQYTEPHVYARDVSSGAGNCVCGSSPDDALHTEIAPGVPVPKHWRARRAFAEAVMAELPEAGEMTEQATQTSGHDVTDADRVARATWRSPLSRLGGGGGYVPLPSDGLLRHRAFPLSLLWKPTVSHGNEDTEGAVDIGVVPSATIEIIDGEPWITGTAVIDLDNPDGAEVARRMSRGFLRWISIMIDSDPDAMPELAEGDEPGEPAADLRDSWRLGNVTVLAQPEFDEATITLDGDEPDNGERDEDRDPEDTRAEKTTTSNGWTSGMVALIPADPDALTVDGGDPVDQLHLTLAYLGEVTEWPEKYVQAVHRVAAEVTGIAATMAEDEAPTSVRASVRRPLTANVFSHAVFNPSGDKPATVYLFDGGADRSEMEFLAADVQAQLRNALGDTDFPQQHTPWVPHVTAGYGLPVDALTYTGPVTFDRLRVALGDDVTDYLLLEPASLVAAVTGNPGLPFADRGRAWDGAGARKRVAAWAKGDGDKIDAAKMAQAFLWRDPDGDATAVTAYRFGVADVINGRLTLVPRGVFAAAAALQGARGGTTVPEADQARMRSKINAMYRRMREAWDDPTLTPPWGKSTTAGLARRRPGEHRSGDMMSKHTNEFGAFTAWSNALDAVGGVSLLASVEQRRQSWAHKLAAVAETLYEPPAEWFQDPKLSRPTPLTITKDGRVFGHAHDWETKHVGYADREVRALNDREDYRAFNLRPLRCADGTVVRAGSLVKGGHASTEPGVTSYAAQAHYDDPAKRVARVTVGRDEHGTWLAGSLVPGISPRDVLDLAECSLSPDWREVDFRNNTGKFVGISVVPNPGLPIIVPADEDLGGYDDASALVAAGAITRERPAWADEVEADELAKLAQEFGLRAADTMWSRFLDHVTASGTAWLAPREPEPAAQFAPMLADHAAALATLSAAVNIPAATLTAGIADPQIVDATALAERMAALAEMARAVNEPPQAVTAGSSSMRTRTAAINGRAHLPLMSSAVNAPSTLAELASKVNGR